MNSAAKLTVSLLFRTQAWLYFVVADADLTLFSCVQQVSGLPSASTRITLKQKPALGRCSRVVVRAEQVQDPPKLTFGANDRSVSFQFWAPYLLFLWLVGFLNSLYGRYWIELQLKVLF